jgi:hypothetical protein
MSNIFETCSAFNLTCGGSIDGVEGTGIPYERILENLGVFETLEEMEMSPDTELYEKTYKFIDDFLTIEN